MIVITLQTQKSSKPTLKKRHRAVSIDIFVIKLLLCHSQHYYSLYKHHSRPDAAGEKGYNNGEYAGGYFAEIEVMYAESAKKNSKQTGPYTVLA